MGLIWCNELQQDDTSDQYLMMHSMMKFSNLKNLIGRRNIIENFKKVTHDLWEPKLSATQEKTYHKTNSNFALLELKVLPQENKTLLS